MRLLRRSPGAQCRLPYATERYWNEWAKASLGFTICLMNSGPLEPLIFLFFLCSRSPDMYFNRNAWDRFESR